jgi:hypothetical protein
MSRQMTTAAITAAIVLASATHAAEVYYASGASTFPGTGTGLIARGFNGFLPIQTINMPPSSLSRTSITASSSEVIVCDGGAVIYRYPLAGLPAGSPAPQWTLLPSLQRDIVAHGDTLLGTSFSGGSLNINTISPTGTLTALLSIPGAASADYTASVSHGKLYLLGATGFGSAPNFHVVNLSTLAVERQAVIAPLSGLSTSTPAELAATPDGTKLLVRYSQSSMQIDTTTLATSAITSNAATSPFAFAQKLSDGFQANYTGPTLAHTTATYSGITPNVLLRKPQTLSGSATLSLLNGIAADGVTPTNVRVDPLLNISAPAGVTSTITQQTSPGDFSARDLGSANYSINLAGPHRGLITINHPSILQADQGDIQVIRSTSLNLAYEPISANIIGNGDFDIGRDRYYGWTFIGGNSFARVPGNQYLSLPAYSGTSGLSIYQDLELGIPDDQLILSFDLPNFGGTPQAPGTGNLRFLLDGQLFYQMSITANAPALSISAIVNVPPTVDWDNPRLSIDFRRTSGSSSDTLFASVDNLSLVFIPEPSLTAALFAPALLLRRPSASRRR